jgi:hypothetical protein
MLTGEVLVHYLTDDEELVDRSRVELHGRSARMLVSEGALRVTIIGLAKNVKLPAHSARAQRQ